MSAKALYFVHIFFLVVSAGISQTNVQGTINANTTWILSNSPYNLTGSLTIRDGATLTIENGVEVRFTTSSYITVGSSSSSRGYLNAAGTTFTGLLSGDARIYFKSNSSQGTFNNCSFNNTYLWIEKSEVTLNTSVFSNCVYPVVLEDGGRLTHSSMTFESSNTNYGIQFKGTLSTDYTMTNNGFPYFIDNLTVNSGATFAIENGVEAKLTSSTAITVGSSTSSRGTLNISGALIKGAITSDSKIYFKSGASSGTVNNSNFDNAYLLVENSEIDVSKTKFASVINPIMLEDGGTVNVSDITYDANVLYPGLGLQGSLKTDYTLTKALSPFYINNLTVRDNSTLTIESQTEVYFTSTTGITAGYSATLKGTIIANDVRFTGLTSGDASIQIKYNSASRLTNCSFNNCFINIDNSLPEISNSRFTQCTYAITTRNNANPVLLNNDFYNNSFAIKNYSAAGITAENNFWGDQSGPTHTDNPNGFGQKAEGLIDFQPFAATPFNGTIMPATVISNIDFNDVVVGAYSEQTIKFITSNGSIDLFISKIETDNPSFTISSSTSYWVAKAETISVKIKFMPQNQGAVNANLIIHINKQGSTPLVIPLTGRGVSPLLATPLQLNFGQVDLKNNKTLSLSIKNRSTRTVTIDSIKITNGKFSFVLGVSSSMLQYDELYGTPMEDISANTLETASLFSLSAGKTKELVVTFKPVNRVVENGILEIYYNTNKKDEIGLTGEGFASPLSVRIPSLNYQNFPFLFLNVAVDTFNVSIPTLIQNNFEVYENGIPQTDNFSVSPPGEGAGSRLTDIIFIMDNSGSMGDEQAAVSNNVINFVNSLANSGVDYALGLCRYGSSASSGSPIVEDNGILTSDPNYFKDNIWIRNVTTGGTEPGYYAIKQSAASFAFRPGAQKIFIIITDENPAQGTVTIDEAISACVENGITLFALTNGTLVSKFTPITNATNGEIYDIRADFAQILDFISNIISTNYLVQYKSSDPLANNSNREVVVLVNYQASTASDIVYYNPGSIPKIQRTDSTLAYHTQAWVEGTSFNITVIVTDEIEPFVQSVNLFYKATNQNFFASIAMNKLTGNKYGVTIPVASVRTPGVDYYITASDGNITASDPKMNPSQNPYQLAILPNVAPDIQHDIVEAAAKNNQININADVTDNTNNVADVKLYYRKSGQINFQLVQMNLTPPNTYSGIIPQAFVTATDLEYFIKATDDFGLSTLHGTVSAPHRITVVALNVPAQIDTLAKGPSIKDVQVPANGAGYCYFKLTSNGSNVFSNSTVKALLSSPTRAVNVEGIFLKPGVFRLDLPGFLFIDSLMTYILGNGITVSDTFYTFNAAPFQIRVKKIPSPFQRTWTIFAGGSAGVSGTAASIGVGVSASAAKLSVKGEAGGGLDIQLDQDDNIFLDRRLELGVSAEVQIPNANLAVASATVATTSATVKTFFGQKFGFTQLGLSQDKIKMAQSGFMLETMAIAGIGLSPGVGAVLAAIVETINATGGVITTFDDALVKNYQGLGLEGNLGAGFKSQFAGVEINALNPSIGSAMNLKFNTFYDHPSVTDNTKGSVEFSQAFNFNFSALDFGLKSKDKFDLGGGNFSLFDAGAGAEFSAEVKLDPSFGFNGLGLTFKGGGGLNLFNASRNTYYSTTIGLPKELYQSIVSSGSSIIGLFTKNRGVPIGTGIVNDAIQTFKSVYSNITSVPIEITTSEIQGNGYALNFGIDLDVAFLIGVGVSFGINGKFYDEIIYPRKYSKVYLNGENYLVYTNNYSDVMKSKEFTGVLGDLFSGVLPLIKQSFLNIINTLETLVIAGRNFIINVASTAGNTIGTIVGTATSGGTWIASTISSHLPGFYQAEPFQPPQFKKFSRSKSVYHSSGPANSNRFTLYESNLVITSDIMNVAFKKDGETVLQDTMANPFTVKMIIYPEDMARFDFSMKDSSKVKIYFYDKDLLNWIYIGGEVKEDTVIAQSNRLGEYALGIELTSISDNEAPEIIDYGPVQSSVWSSFPEVYAVIRENKFGSGLDLLRTKMLINETEVDYLFDPGNSRIYIQTTGEMIDRIATIRVEITVYDIAGNFSKINFDFRANITSLNDEIPEYKYQLHQNYPNPFNPVTQIRFSVARRGKVEIYIYDVKGSLVKKLFNGELDAGDHSVEWDGTNNLEYKVSSGVYFYQLKADNFNVVKKMQLIK